MQPISCTVRVASQSTRVLWLCVGTIRVRGGLHDQRMADVVRYGRLVQQISAARTRR